jgi:ABC-type dipeptide/oligopeptide/nickel transport system permease component
MRITRRRMGQLLITSIENRDYTVVQGAVFVTATLFILVNLASDLALGWLDPRVGDGMACASLLRSPMTG